jgi:hypothetical protein
MIRLNRLSSWPAMRTPVQQPEAVPETPLTMRLVELRRRLWWYENLPAVVRAAWLSIVAGLLLSYAGYAVMTWLPPLLPVGVTTVLFATQCWRISRRHIPLLAVARAYDARLGLKERLATAVELQSRFGGPAAPGDEAASTIAAFQVRHATALAQRIRPAEAYPLRLPPVQMHALTLTLSAALILPFWDSVAVSGSAGLLDTGALGQTEALAAAEGQQPETRAAQPQDVQELINEINRQLAEKQITPEEALSMLRQAQWELDIQRSAFDATAQKAFNELAKALKDMALTRPLSESLSRQEYDRAARQMEALAQNLQNLTPQERQALAERLRQAAEQAARADARTAQQMRSASEGLEQQSDQQAQDALRQMAQQLMQRAQAGQAQQDLERAVQDLAALARQQQEGAQQAQARGRLGAAGGMPADQAQGARSDQQQGAQGQGSSERGARGSGAGRGDGTGESNSEPAPRLNVNARSVPLPGVLSDAPPTFRPIPPDSAPLLLDNNPLPLPPAAPTIGGASEGSHFVPLDRTQLVRQYFGSLGDRR